MKLVRYERDGEIRVGLREDDEVVDATAALTSAGSGLEAALTAGTANGFDAVAKRIEATSPNRHPLSEVTLQAPVPERGRVFALGGVYTQHLRERGQNIVAVPSQWYVPESAVIGPGSPIKLPERVATNVKPAVELGVVIGKEGAYVDESDALNHVAGYTVVNDVTARTDWPGPMAYKLLDTFSPTGPHIRTYDEAPHPIDLEMAIQSGDERICHGHSSGMRFSIPFLVSFLSSVLTLRPGDVIATGDPGGVNGTLTLGTEVAARIQGVGTLTNPVTVRESGDLA